MEPIEKLFMWAEWAGIQHQHSKHRADRAVEKAIREGRTLDEALALHKEELAMVVEHKALFTFLESLQDPLEWLARENAADGIESACAECGRD